MWVVLLSGKMGAGKDTLAKILQQKYNFKVYHFADKLKKILLQVGWDGKKDESGRMLLQNVGNAVRAYNQDAWVDILFKEIISDIIEEGYDRICIADWRFKNEYNSLKEKCIKRDPYTIVFPIRIIRNTNDVYNDQTIHQDISETDLDDFNEYAYIVYNNQDISYLEKAADEIVKKLEALDN